MRGLTMYLGLAFAACLSCFSLSAFAEPLVSSYRTAYVSAEPQGVALQRLELTLAMWRTGSQPEGQALKSNLRASSNHFVMTTFKVSPDGVGLSPC